MRLGNQLQKLREEQKMSEEEKEDDDELFHPGFYIGIGIMFLGTLLSLIIGNLTITMVSNIAGMLIACFYKGILKLLKDVKKDFYEQG
ncbi:MULTISPECIES: hypothetical protein [Priestia]|uniref:Uncharacterized protein n=1 Tax=Priestia megaterium (strain ATCC 12872 / QMB1551) TaxID=545693 RepID=D5DZP1_PRIM1|nr:MULTISPECIES: hypothetical protein [Priestia]ADE70442.1 hypothetical protein BMQ_3420 [Priestia megaterium QM B1551]MUL30474.1 hypothetical protein [Priestia megaterium]QLK05572.1 hypothetical protein BMG_2077 [Priestia megaterium]WDM35705.1 hypothetical protein J8N01_11280 [Priestia megaterium]